MLTNKFLAMSCFVWSAGGVLLLGLLSGCSVSGPEALREGKRLLERDRPEEAVRRLEVATDLMRTNATAWNYLGLAHHSAGQFTNALNAYQHALDLNPSLAEARFNLGCLYLEMRKPELATNEFTAFTVRRAQDIEGWVKLGTAQLRARNLAGAERSFTRALQLSSNHVESLNGLGIAQLQRNRVREAANYFQRALAVQPGYAPALLNLAIVEQQHLSNPSQALAHYRAYLSLQPPPPAHAQAAAAAEALANQLTYRLRVTNAPPANPSVTNLAPRPAPAVGPAPVRSTPTRTNPPPTVVGTSAPPDITRSPAQTRVEESRDARKETAPAVAVRAPGRGDAAHEVEAPAEVTTQLVVVAAAPRFPSNPAALRFKRYAYTIPAPRPGNRNEALPKFNEGLSAQRAGDLNAASIAYRAALQKDPGFYEAHYNLGVAAYEAGQISIALTAYETALALRPDAGDARYNFALALRAADYPLDAAEELKKLIVSNANEARVHVSLGHLYVQQLGQPSLARQHYLQALALEPAHPQAAALRAWLMANP